jgi:Ca2+-binding EF-hand superfamily protein
MNGLYELDATTLHDLLSTTPIEAFDPVEEAFKLLDVEGKGYVTVETFKEIFKNLNFGEITPSDEEIFKEVADFDKDGVINLDDFRKILKTAQEQAEEEERVKKREEEARLALEAEENEEDEEAEEIN